MKENGKYFKYAMTMIEYYTSKKSALFTARGNFYLMFLDARNNPLHEKLGRSCLAVVYAEYDAPDAGQIVTMANPLTRNFIEKRPSLIAVWHMLREKGLNHKSALIGTKDFCLAIYDLLVTIGEFRYIGQTNPAFDEFDKK